MKTQNKSRQISLMAMFAAIIFILAFTPIGYIQLPFIKATIIHIPVIIGAVLFGPKYGAVLGFMFGVTSLINNTIAPTVSSFVFSPLISLPGTDNGSPLALIICFIPRILVGVLPWFVYNAMKKLTGDKFEAVSFAVAGVIGSLTNTLLVMHLIFFIFRDSYAMVRNIAVDTVYNVILGIIAVNGIPEAIAAGIITAAACVPLKIVLSKK